MADWFRNTAWNDDVEAAFESRLGRARGKAQYLNIQAYMLLATHPQVAADLARRALALGDPAEVPRAGLYLGTALAISGDLDGAIAALECAIEAERRDPMHRTAAHLDQALLVALAQRADLYDLVLGRLDKERLLPLTEQSLSALIAQALIGGERGEEVSSVATAALGALGDLEEATPLLPGYLSPDLIHCRLAAIASR